MSGSPVSAPTVSTDRGQVVGHREHARGVELDAFKGIPYAAPPVGERRLRPPAPHPGWREPLSAAEFGAAPHQPPSPLTQAMNLRQSEDCLTLNVWTPGCDDGRRPVMVWFHGGSFTTGGSGISWYHGASLASRGVVVVTVNYRLGPLGFLHLDPIGGDEWAGSANLGLADQVAALGWVADNIAAFGGDPEAVTVFGESAGAMSVTTQMAVPAAAGRFRRVIAQSGAAGHVQQPDTAEEVARRVLDALGVGPRRLADLAHLPADAFIEASAAADGGSGAFLALPFQPTVDGVLIPRHPLDAVAQGDAAGVDLLVGTNGEEMRLWHALAQVAGEAGGTGPTEEQLLGRVGKALSARGLPHDPAEVVSRYRRRLGADAPPAEVLTAVGGDLVFRVPAAEVASAQSAHARTYGYLFTHRSTAFGGLLGAAHAMEIPFVFDNLDVFGTDLMLGPIDDDRRSLASAMADAWCAFAATGDPSTPSLPWPRYQPSTRDTMIWDLRPQVESDPWGDELSAWLG